jgi:hypothetical protein
MDCGKSVDFKVTKFDRRKADFMQLWQDYCKLMRDIWHDVFVQVRHPRRVFRN